MLVTFGISVFNKPERKKCTHEREQYVFLFFLFASNHNLSLWCIKYVSVSLIYCIYLWASHASTQLIVCVAEPVVAWWDFYTLSWWKRHWETHRVSLHAWLFLISPLVHRTDVRTWGVVRLLCGGSGEGGQIWQRSYRERKRKKRSEIAVQRWMSCSGAWGLIGKKHLAEQAANRPPQGPHTHSHTHSHRLVVVLVVLFCVFAAQTHTITTEAIVYLKINNKNCLWLLLIWDEATEQRQQSKVTARSRVLLCLASRARWGFCAAAAAAGKVVWLWRSGRREEMEERGQGHGAEGAAPSTPLRTTAAFCFSSVVWKSLAFISTVFLSAWTIMSLRKVLFCLFFLCFLE